MDTEMVSSIAFFAACILFAANSFGVDTFVCLRIGLFFRGSHKHDLINKMLGSRQNNSQAHC